MLGQILAELTSQFCYQRRPFSAKVASCTPTIYLSLAMSDKNVAAKLFCAEDVELKKT